jgi:endonuclease/exonuclease/phosphatase family metal-dependent hydrolase
VSLLFLQEMPADDDWILRRGWTLFKGSGAQYRSRSGLAARGGLASELQPLEFATAAYHGTYVAAAQRPASAGGLSLMSVHASPTRPTSAERERWTAALPPMRSAGELWDADFVLQTLADEVARGHSLLAAGDFNESRLWDDTHPGTWGADFFARVEDVGLVDVSRAKLESELPTRGEYQIDYVLATRDVAGRVHHIGLGPHPGADHESLHFTIDL